MLVYLMLEDLMVGVVGPFTSVEEVKAHQKFMEERGDADAVGTVISHEEAMREIEQGAQYYTPEEDRRLK